MFSWLNPITQNTEFRGKKKKHTNRSTSDIPSKDISWSVDGDTYDHYQFDCAETSAVYFDIDYSYLFLYDTPSGAHPIASFQAANSSTTIGVSGIKMPLNSKPNELHHHYSNHEENWLKISDYNPSLAIRFPGYSGERDFQVISGGHTIFTYDPGCSGYYFNQK